MMPSPQGKTGPLTKAKPVYQDSYTAHRSEPSECDTDGERLESLRRQFLSLGLSVHQLTGAEMVVTGPGAPSRSVPDIRSGWLYLRQMRGAA